MLSLPGYFEHIGQKTCIDKYPQELITLEELRGKRLVEFGAGKGNDIRLLIEKAGLRPADVFYTEADSVIFDSVYEELEELFAPDPIETTIWTIYICLMPPSSAWHMGRPREALWAGP